MHIATVGTCGRHTPDSCIEIINNTRGDIEGKIWECGDWGGGGQI